MQFSCESCKAQLQIADEKVRGKRLIVRCRRCGAKIALADPLLANSSPRLIERSPAPTPGPMRITPRPEPARPEPTDDESTRAMDSEVLERALQASKADEPERNGVPTTGKMHFPRPAVPLEDVEWFAMIRGKQAGPLTRDELIARANDGEVGPRTYLWRDGMDAWHRALDVPELHEMFPQVPPVPHRPPPAPPAATAAPGPVAPQAPRVVPSPAPAPAAVRGETAVATARPVEVARWMASEVSSEVDPSAERVEPPVKHRVFPWVERTPMFESKAPTERGPFTVFLGLMALAAAAIVLWIVLAAPPAMREEAKSDPKTQASPPPAAGPQAPSPEQKPREPQPEPPREAAQAAPASPGLTADQVHRKLDENKPALQGCVDEALVRDPNLKVGKIYVATTIAPSGQVTSARIDQKAVDESPLGACLKRATRRIVFPAFAGAAFDVDIPIVVTAESP